jgi:hypothetical protein
MIARPAQTDPPDAFARTVLSVAAEVEAAESAIKQTILEAARAGDTASIINIITRWMSTPAIEVLSKNALANMREIQVSQDVPPDASGRQ